MQRRTFLLLFGLLFIALILDDNVHATSYVNPNQTYTYMMMTKDIKTLASKYPGLVTYKSLGKTPYGREIWAVRLGKGDATVFINGSHHGREWITTNLVMEMIDRYSHAYKTKKMMHGYNVEKVLNETSIWFIPMVNPDGVTLQQKGLSAFPKKDHSKLIKMNNGSKNFKRWKANAQGIDLNRQYPSGWGIRDVKKPWYKNYAGKTPLTATEAKIVANFTYWVDPEITISYHSSGRILYWHYKTKPEHYARDHKIATDIGAMTKYRLVTPSKYATGGGHTDWFITQFGRPGLTPELSYYVYETNPPISVFKEEWKRNSKVGLYTAVEGKKLWDKKLQLTQRDISTFGNLSMYDRPDSKRKTTFQLKPQDKIRVNAEKGSYYRINTANGLKWIEKKNTIDSPYKKINQNILLTERTELFTMPKTTSKTTLVLQTQQVAAVKQWKNWYGIRTGNGERWINSSKIITNFNPVKFEKQVLVASETTSFRVPNVHKNQTAEMLIIGQYHTKQSWNNWVLVGTNTGDRWISQADAVEFSPVAFNGKVLITNDILSYSLPNIKDKLPGKTTLSGVYDVKAKWNNWMLIKDNNEDRWVINDTNILNFNPSEVVGEILEITEQIDAYTLPIEKENLKTILLPQSVNVKEKWNGWKHLKNEEVDVWIKGE